MLGEQLGHRHGFQAFFDTVPWDLVCRAVATVCDLPWVMLYVRRWLKAPAQQGDGTLTERWRGTPQGSAVSPVVANLFMHYALDAWLARNFAGVVFERYADDVVICCKSLEQARAVLAAVGGAHEAGGAEAAPAQDPDRVLQGREPDWLMGAHRVHVPGV